MEKQSTRTTVPINERRLLSKKGLAAYLSISVDKAAEYGEQVGAVVRIGKRVLFDRLTIDKAVDETREGHN